MEAVDKKMISHLHGMLSRARIITTISHVHPDGDAIGSSLAMLEFLRVMGKDAASVFPDPAPDSLSFLAGEMPRTDILSYSGEPRETVARLQASDLIICLDFNDFTRVEGLRDILLATQAPKVLIDHHKDPDLTTFDLAFSRVDVSSTCELLYHILLEMPEIQGDPSRLPQAAAHALMTGMTTDTNNFANSTYPSTFAMAAGLLRAGVNRDDILVHVLQDYPLRRLRVLGKLLDSGLHLTPEGVAWMVLDLETSASYGLTEGDTEGFVNVPLSVRDIRMSIFLKQESDTCLRVSIRSKRGFSALALARKCFHGGGHLLAAGGKLWIGQDVASLAEVPDFLERNIADFFSSKNGVIEAQVQVNE